MARPAAADTGLIQGLGLLDATTLVIGSMIGSGIFIVSADIARQVHSPALLIATWLVTALLTLIAALSYGELAAAMPQAGGQYVYLREAFGPLCGFLYGWTLLLVIQTGTIAAVAVAFAKFAGVFFPWVTTDRWLVRLGPLAVNSQQLVAIAVLAGLTWINTRGVRAGALVQNVFTFTKTAALLGLIGLGLLLGRDPAAIERNFGRFWDGAEWDFTAVRLVGVAMVGALFSSDAWNNVTFAAAEIRNPRRNVPLALALGVSIVSALYLACNFVYLSVLPLEAIQQAPEDRVATAAAQSILGPAAVYAMAAAIMISTFGCANGMILAGARVYYAMARDGLLFRSLARLDPRHRTPNVSLVAQCLWACGLTLSGTYSDLLDYVIFAVLLFYILTIAGVFVLRWKRPEMHRPYRAVGYPVLPALYIALAGLIEALLLAYKPRYTWPGLLIVLLGVPFFWLWKRRAPGPSQAH
ncbi:MAG: amino acid permease [Bryobacterales bacterium]|nr:amino acid permease [Bryobacteraceae bacterium]MDW8129181.1 amino acid permease [Bryobacterales bacterium]